MIGVSLGGWCRPAWQIRRGTGLELAMPYDWQITSFKALKSTLAREYDPQRVLQPEDLVVNQFGSLTDRATGWIYHHDLSIGEIDTLGGDVQFTKRTLEKVSLARQKFVFLFERFRKVCKTSDIVFFRWLRSGHPDGEWPEAFAEESAKEILDLLVDIGIKDSCQMVTVTSIEAAAPSGVEINYLGRNIEVKLREDARNFRPEAWTGDDIAWDLLLARILKRHGEAES